MNKVLVTGLAIGKEVGICDACNFDMEWLVKYPSVLIWADRILVPDTIWEMVSMGWPPKHPPLAKSLQLIFDMGRAEDIIEIVHPADVIDPALKDAIFTEVYKDRALLAKVLPDRVTLGDEEKVPGSIFIDGYEYCSPFIGTMYASLVLARAWDAHCLFSKPVFNYCTYKFGLSGFPKEGEPGRTQGFQAVFDAYVPNVSILPAYVLFTEDSCVKCAKEQDCKDKYLSELEENLRKLIAWRDYDEIQQLKAVVEDIARRRSKSGGVVDPADILYDFRSRETKLRRIVRSVFPKVERWANITTMLSIPVAVAGVATKAPLITVAGAGMAGLSKLTKELVKLLSSKYSWIGFVSKEVRLSKEA